MAFDIVVDAEARFETADEWRALALMAGTPRVWAAVEALALSRASDAERLAPLAQ